MYTSYTLISIMHDDDSWKVWEIKWKVSFLGHHKLVYKRLLWMEHWMNKIRTLYLVYIGFAQFECNHIWGPCDLWSYTMYPSTANTVNERWKLDGNEPTSIIVSVSIVQLFVPYQMRPPNERMMLKHEMMMNQLNLYL